MLRICLLSRCVGWRSVRYRSMGDMLINGDGILQPTEAGPGGGPFSAPQDSGGGESGGAVLLHPVFGVAGARIAAPAFPVFGDDFNYLGDLAAVSSIFGITKKFRARLRVFARGLRPYAREMLVTSSFREPAENVRVGGAPNSLHLVGEAVDFSLPAELHTDGGLDMIDRAARRARVRAIAYPQHLHVDTAGRGLLGGSPLAGRPAFTSRLSLLGGEGGGGEIERQTTMW